MKSIKKICHITTVHPAKDVRIFHKECTSLALAGYEVSLLVLNDNSELCNKVNIVGVKHTFKGRFDRIKNSPKIALKAALKIDADLYHFHDPELLRIALKLKRKGKKVIYDVHEDVPRQILAKYWIPNLLRQMVSYSFEKYENRIAAQLDYIVTATPFIRERFLKINRHTIDVNNYPKLNEFDFSTTPPIDSNNICYIGGIEKIRGILELIDAVENSSIQLTLAGKFSDAQLENAVKQLNGWKNVKFLGFLGREEINQLLYNSVGGMVTLHPTPNYLDALPVKMFEYMAAGIPVIASDFPLWRTIIHENECGILVNPLDPNAIRTAAESLINDKSLAKKYGANGRKAILEKYNWDIEAKKLVGIYQQILQPTGAD